MKRTIAALALAAATARAAEAPPGITEHTLKNGVRALLWEDHSAPVASFVVFYKVGSRNETTGNTGSAHLLEHMQFKGTKKHPQIWAELKKMGALFNANTFVDWTNYYATVPADKLDAVIELEADRMRNSLLLDAERQKEFSVVRNELENGENDPAELLNTATMAAAFQAYPYHHPIIGWRSDVEGVPTSKLKEHYDIYYQPPNAVVAVVGDFDAQKTLASIEKAFGAFPGGQKIPEIYTTEPPQKGERRVVVKQVGEQNLVQLEIKAPGGTHEDFAALKLLQLVLSGGLRISIYPDALAPGVSNRLYRALVEKELCTQASAGYVALIADNTFSLSAQLRPGVAHDKVEKAIWAELDRLAGEKIPEAELKRAKDRAQAALILALDGTDNRAKAIGYYATVGDWKKFYALPERLAALTAGDLMRVGKKYFQRDQTTVGWFVAQKPPAEKHARGSRRARTIAMGPDCAHPTAARRGSLRHPCLAPIRLPSDRFPHAWRPQTWASADRLVLAAANPREAAAAPQGPKFAKKVLANGLTVIVQESHGNPTVAVAGTVRAGKAFEPAQRSGISGIAAEMLSRGTKKHTKEQFNEALEAVGASLSFGAGPESASFEGKALTRDRGLLLELLAEALTQPAFPAAELKKTKGEAVAAIKNAEDYPATRAQRAFAQGLYPKGHPYYQDDAAAQVKAVEAIGPKDLAAFHALRYTPDATVIAVVGDVSAEEAFASVEKILGGWKGKSAAVEIADVPLREKTDRVIIPMPEKEQASVEVLYGHQFPIRRASPDYYAAFLANRVVGTGGTGRLFQTIRNERGLSYGAYAWFTPGIGAGPWNAWMTVAGPNVDQAIAAMNEVLAKYAAEGPTEAELADAKANLIGQFRVGLSTNSALARQLADLENQGVGAEEIDRYTTKLAAVTREQVMAALKQYFHFDRGLLVIAGPYAAPKT